jgi:hypothetical protein
MPVRIGVVLMVLSLLCWLVIPFAPVVGFQGAVLAAVIGGLVVVAEIVFWLGLILIGRDTWRLARERGWRRVPGALWRLLLDGRAPQPRPADDG